MLDPGLCGDCRHARVVETRASRFYLCRMSEREPQRFPRYPRLPVVRCPGHEPAAREPQ